MFRAGQFISERDSWLQASQAENAGSGRVPYAVESDNRGVLGEEPYEREISPGRTLPYDEVYRLALAHAMTPWPPGDTSAISILSFSLIVICRHQGDGRTPT